MSFFYRFFFCFLFAVVFYCESFAVCVVSYDDIRQGWVVDCQTHFEDSVFIPAEGGGGGGSSQGGCTNCTAMTPAECAALKSQLGEELSRLAIFSADNSSYISMVKDSIDEMRMYVDEVDLYRDMLSSSEDSTAVDVADGLSYTVSYLYDSMDSVSSLVEEFSDNLDEIDSSISPLQSLVSQMNCSACSSSGGGDSGGGGSGSGTTPSGCPCSEFINAVKAAVDNCKTKLDDIDYKLQGIKSLLDSWDSYIKDIKTFTKDIRTVLWRWDDYLQDDLEYKIKEFHTKWTAFPTNFVSASDFLASSNWTHKVHIDDVQFNALTNILNNLLGTNRYFNVHISSSSFQELRQLLSSVATSNLVEQTSVFSNVLHSTLTSSFSHYSEVVSSNLLSSTFVISNLFASAVTNISSLSSSFSDFSTSLTSNLLYSSSLITNLISSVTNSNSDSSSFQSALIDSISNLVDSVSSFSSITNFNSVVSNLFDFVITNCPPCSSNFCNYSEPYISLSYSNATLFLDYDGNHINWLSRGRLVSKPSGDAVIDFGEYQSLNWFQRVEFLLGHIAGIFSSTNSTTADFTDDQKEQIENVEENNAWSESTYNETRSTIETMIHAFEESVSSLNPFKNVFSSPSVGKVTLLPDVPVDNALIPNGTFPTVEIDLTASGDGSFSLLDVVELSHNITTFLAFVFFAVFDALAIYRFVQALIALNRWYWKVYHSWVSTMFNGGGR